MASTIAWPQLSTLLQLPLETLTASAACTSALMRMSAMSQLNAFLSDACLWATAPTLSHASPHTLVMDLEMKQARLVQAVLAVAAVPPLAGQTILQPPVEVRDRLLQAALQSAEKGRAALQKCEQELDSDQRLLVQLRGLLGRWEHSPLFLSAALPQVVPLMEPTPLEGK